MSEIKKAVITVGDGGAESVLFLLKSLLDDGIEDMTIIITQDMSIEGSQVALITKEDMQ